MTNYKAIIFWLVILIDILLLIGWLALAFLTWQQVSLDSTAVGLNNNQSKIAVSELKHFFDFSHDKIVIIDSSVIDSDNVNSLVDQILALALIAGVEVTIDRAQPVSDGLELDISAKGSFNHSIQFLRLMEKLPYRLVISKENLINQAGAGGDVFPVKSNNVASLWRPEISLKILSYHQ